MIEEHNSAEEDDNLFTIFSVFDPEHNGFIEGQQIKKALLSLTDVPIEEVDEIIEKAGITDERKMSLEGNNHHDHRQLLRRFPLKVRAKIICQKSAYRTVMFCLGKCYQPSLRLRLRLITLTSTLIISDITKTNKAWFTLATEATEAES